MTVTKSAIVESNNQNLLFISQNQYKGGINLKTLFEYNWEVRNEWFECCKNLSKEELLFERVGGVGNILHTLVHIVDVEYSWIRAIQGRLDFELNFNEYTSVESIVSLSETLKSEVKEYLQTWSRNMEKTPVKVSWSDEIYTKGEILRHIIAHEIHHIGQLSIWARELGLKPVSPNLIGRKLLIKE